MKNLKIESLSLESGKQLENINIAYQTFGKMNNERSNIVWVFHAISGDTNVFDWWSALFGEGKIYDPASYFIICANCLGSPYGSTKPENLDFPQFTVRDQVQAFLKLAEALEIQSIHTLIGGSFGGYQALEFAYSFEGDIGHQILIACSARESAWGIAIHEAQRMALKADSTFGISGGGQKGLQAARALAVLTYRTSEKLIQDQTDKPNRLDDFKASSYINYQGHKFSERFDALSLYYLTQCIDAFHIGRNRGGEIKALHAINIPTLVIGFPSDLLVPIVAQRFLAQHLPQAVLAEIDSTYGHDGFLMEEAKLSKKIIKFYNDQNYPAQRKSQVANSNLSTFQPADILKTNTFQQNIKYEATTTLHVFAIGKGTVGAEFINQILKTSDCLVKERKIRIKLIGVCDSKKYILNGNGIKINWRASLQLGKSYNSHAQIISELKNLDVQNIVIVDNTASNEVSAYYEEFVKSDFDIVASNKIFNAGELTRYKDFKKLLDQKRKNFHYETNVGAALPIISLLKNLQNSSNRATRLRGVLSGSLSYIFNNFSDSDKPFSYFVQHAVRLGMAEPDPRIDLRGLDVGRKLVILARAMDLDIDLKDIRIENLVPYELRHLKSLQQFSNHKETLDAHFEKLRKNLGRDEVLRYVAEIDVDKKMFCVELKKVAKSHSLAQLKNADNYFEVFTKTCQEQPIIIKGKGAGPAVTAKGVFSDVLKLA